MRIIKTCLLLCGLLALSACKPAKVITTETGYPGKVTRLIAPISFGLVAGMANGVHETVVHHPNQIPKDWNLAWWDARQSWTNKYKDNDPGKGPRFLGSTTAFVWTTDAKHLFGTVHRVGVFGAGLSIGLGQRRPVWHYLLDAGLSFAAYTIGFHIIYK